MLKQTKWIERVEKLINYMNYEWDQDEKWKEYMKKKFKPQKKNENDEAGEQEDKKQLELMRRAYYGDQVEKDFEKNFDFENEEERARYFNYCAFYGNLGNIGPEGKKTISRPMIHHFRRTLYFIFLFVLPSRLPYLPMIYLLALICSFLQTSRPLMRQLSDDEAFNMALLLGLLFSGPFMKMLIYAALLQWAVLVWIDWVDEILQKNPNQTGVALLRPFIAFGTAYKIEILQMKNHIELFIGLISIVMVLTGKAAPIFPIFYWQYIRIKYVVSYFTKNSFLQLDQQILKRIFPQFIYNTVIQPIKNKLSYFVNTQDQPQIKTVEKSNSEIQKNKKND